MSKCLVTGHKGYIGSEVYETLKNMGHEVMAIDLKEDNDILQELKPDADGKYLDINFSPTKNYIGAMEGL